MNHTDHANLARLESLNLSRIDPKHFRWYAEIVEGGSVLYHRPGVSALHEGPDGLSRNVEGRDQLILSKSTECDYWRARIKGIQTALRDGTAEDEEQEARTVDKVPVKDLEPFPHAKGLAVSLNYERKSQEHKYGGTARGDESKGEVPSKNIKKKN